MGDYKEYGRSELRGPDSIVNSIIMKRNYPGKNLFSFLIVEGHTDKKLYQSFINAEKCYIEIAYGKPGVIDVLGTLERDKFAGVAAIIDSDFDILEERNYPSQNLFLTDAHDAEIMILQSPSFEKFLREFASEDKLNQFTQKCGKNIREALFERSLIIGYLRWLSLQQELSFKFEDLDFSKFVELATLKVDESKLIRTLQNTVNNSGSKNRKRFSDTEIKEKLQQIQSKPHDPTHICCGHDFVCLLSLGLRKALGSASSKIIEPDLIEKSLRLAFEAEYFSETQLYTSLKEWERANAPFILLN